jgi:hypothetical protein
VPDGGDKARNVLNVANQNADVVEVTINGKTREIGPFSMITQEVGAGELTVASAQPVYASLTSSVERKDGKVISNIALTDAGESIPTTKLVVER